MSSAGFSSHLLASGPGWEVRDIVCTAGPDDRLFEEQHDAMCIAAVMRGSFQYRASHGAAMLAPGALLLGNEGACFECGHEHGRGDRCLAFHFSRAHLENIVAALPGVRRARFDHPRLPPLSSLMPLLATAEAARDDADTAALEDLAFRLPAAVVATLAESDLKARQPSERDQRRVAEGVRRIEAKADEPDAPSLKLPALARTAAMSPYHFLRVFQDVVGMTPHQYVLHTRMHRAAVRLRRTDEAISTIAFAAGFNDLSTFNRRF